MIAFIPICPLRSSERAVFQVWPLSQVKGMMAWWVSFRYSDTTNMELPSRRINYTLPHGSSEKTQNIPISSIFWDDGWMLYFWNSAIA